MAGAPRVGELVRLLDGSVATVMYILGVSIRNTPIGAIPKEVTALSDAQDDAVQQLITRARNLLDDRDDDNNINRAETLLQQVVLIAPEEGAIWQGLGDVCWFNNEYRIAIEHYNRARELGVDNAALWRRMATTYAEFYQREDALAAIDRALQLAPADQSVLFDFIKIVTKLKLWHEPTMREQALRVANRAEELASQDIHVQARVIDLLVILRLDDASLKERTLGALASFVAAPVPSESRPWFLGKFVTYSGMLVLDGRYREALAVVEYMLTLAQEIDSVSSRLLWNKGLTHRAILLAQLGAYDEALHALEHYRRVLKSPRLISLEKSPELIWRALYPELLLETGRVSEALEQVELLFSDIEKQSREYIDRQQLIARNAAILGNTESAQQKERLLSEAQSRAQEYAYPLQVKARILAKLGRDDEAIVAEHAAATRANTTTPLDTLIPQVP